MPRGVSIHASWTPGRDMVLRHLWQESYHSAREIAFILGPGFTKNSIIGRAHRLKLPKKKKGLA